jgi:hypothetical protein
VERRDCLSYLGTSLDLPRATPPPLRRAHPRSAASCPMMLLPAVILVTVNLQGLFAASTGAAPGSAPSRPSPHRHHTRRTQQEDAVESSVCAADFNDDGKVETNDLLYLLATFGREEADQVSDLNQNGRVDTADLLMLLAAFGRNCIPEGWVPPVCEDDPFASCGTLLALGTFTCDDSFCPTCPFMPERCDVTCNFCLGCDGVPGSGLVIDSCGTCGGDGLGCGCTPNPCANGAPCVQGESSATCMCVPGYDGPLCGVDVDECTSAPCANGGACAHAVDSYSCNCVDGYIGENCEIDVDECAPAPCENGGACTDEVGYFTCDCVGGYIGDRCEVADDGFCYCNEFTDSLLEQLSSLIPCVDGETYRIGAICVPLTACADTEFELTAATPTSDRICAQATTEEHCSSSGQRIVNSATATSDAVCGNQEEWIRARIAEYTSSTGMDLPEPQGCDSGLDAVSLAVESLADIVSCEAGQTYLFGAVCIPLTLCGTDEYESIPPADNTDRICAPVSTCASPLTVVYAATATADTVCGTQEAFVVARIQEYMDATGLTATKIFPSAETPYCAVDLGSGTG